MAEQKIRLSENGAHKDSDFHVRIQTQQDGGTIWSLDAMKKLEAI